MVSRGSSISQFKIAILDTITFNCIYKNVDLNEKSIIHYTIITMHWFNS